MIPSSRSSPWPPPRSSSTSRSSKHGITAYETDLAELIVQLGDDLPSHILVPAIHKNRSQIRQIFLDEMGKSGMAAPAISRNDPQALAAAARAHLRQRFLSAKVAISGANFVIADTGALVVVESEGNGRMCLTLPETLISVVGHREDSAQLAEPRGLHAIAAAIVDGRTDEPLHVDLHRSDPGQRSLSLSPGAHRQRTQLRPRRRDGS